MFGSEELVVVVKTETGLWHGLCVFGVWVWLSLHGTVVWGKVVQQITLWGRRYGVCRMQVRLSLCDVVRQSFEDTLRQCLCSRFMLGCRGKEDKLVWVSRYGLRVFGLQDWLLFRAAQDSVRQ